MNRMLDSIPIIFLIVYMRKNSKIKFKISNDMLIKIPKGFTPNKLYEKPKLIFSSSIKGNFDESRVREISHDIAISACIFMSFSSVETWNESM